MKKIIFTILIILVAIILSMRIYTAQPEEVEVSERVEKITKMITPQEINDDSVQGGEEETKENIEQEVLPNEEKTSIQEIKPETILSVPFIVQAPFADWSERYKETCEEASVLMVDQYYKKMTTLEQQQMKDLLDPLADWGDTYFAGRYDTNVAETAKYFTEYLGYDTDRIQFIENPTIDELKTLLANGIPIIAPAAGRELGNKFFQTPGPIYHMLVITGYDKNEFITNDPGTRRGEGYRYDQEVLIQAIHDWTGNYDTIQEGKSIVMVVTP